MASNRQEFIEWALAQQALKFGEFVLKSGRVSPYFFNCGQFTSGAALATLGKYYQKTISESGIVFDQLFGPAYKGIPLVSATAIAFSQNEGRDVPYAFNRKEVKDHGEGGQLVGKLKGRVLIVDDVITAGTATAESVQIIQAAGAEPVGLVIALDRQERGQGTTSAIDEIKKKYKIPVLSIIRRDDLLAFVKNTPQFESFAEKMDSYCQEYGVVG